MGGNPIYLNGKSLLLYSGVNGISEDEIVLIIKKLM